MRRMEGKSPSTRNLRLERLESRRVLNAEMVISEFVASNAQGYLDYDDADSDWIELHNRGVSNVDLEGWYLTDNEDNLAKWRIPVSTVLMPDERKVLFASNKDFVAPNGELHTNFKLAAGGEFLALVDPTGVVVDSFEPVYPSQATNASYGIHENVEAISLINSETTARALIPTDDVLGLTWTGADGSFDDATWIQGIAGIGYETEPIGGLLPQPVAYWSFDRLIEDGTIALDVQGNYDATVSGATVTTVSQGRFGKALAFDGVDDYVSPGVMQEMVSPSAFSVSLWFRRLVDHPGEVNETMHRVHNVLIANSVSGSNDNFEIGSEGGNLEMYLDTEELGGAIPPLREPAPIRNNAWHHLLVTYDGSASSGSKLYLDGTLISEQSEYGGLVSSSEAAPLTIGLARPGPDSEGAFEGLIDDVAIWDVSLTSQQVSDLAGGMSPGVSAGYTPLIGLDLQDALAGQNSSAYVRTEFTVDDSHLVSSLRLRMQYDDAFVAYINGAEVVRSGISGTPQWNSVADADRPDFEALRPVDFQFSVPGILHDGINVLAIQTLNAEASSERLLMLPELEVFRVFRDIPILHAGADVSAFVPTDGSLGWRWTEGDGAFNDSSWVHGKTGVGFDTVNPGGLIVPPIAYWNFDELAEDGTMTPDQQGNYDGVVSGATLTDGGQGRFGEALSFDGNNDFVSAGVVAELVNPAAFSISLWFRRAVDHGGGEHETNHFVNNVLVAHSASGVNDTFEIGTEGNLIEWYLDSEELGGSIPPIREPASVQNDVWHHLVATYDSHDSFEVKLYLDGALVREYADWGGLISNSDVAPLTFGLSRPNGAEWGDFEGLIDDVAVWDATLNAQHVAALRDGVSPRLLPVYVENIGLDVGAELYGRNTSAFVRIPFTVDDPDSLVSLTLHLQYDDAFVAYLNGTEVARSNVTGSLHWNSAADSDRSDLDSLQPERFVIANHSGLLHDQPQENILAIHGLNASLDASRFLMRPELSAVPRSGQKRTFMATPTPGTANVGTFDGFMAPPIFSVNSQTFTDAFSLKMSSIEPNVEIRYTTDGKVPDESSLLYTGPIMISTTTQVRAVVFRSGYVPSEVVGQTYIHLSPSVLNFSSNLPVIVIEKFQRGISAGTFRNGVMAVFEPDVSGRTRLTNPVDLISRIGVHRRGSSTGGNGKVNLRLETRDEMDADQAFELLGLPAESDWVLFGPYTFDRALIRNPFIFELSRQMGRYASRTRFVEVYGNFVDRHLSQYDYLGLYTLEEVIKADANRVAIDRLSTQQNSEPEITGGYIVKNDRPSGDAGEIVSSLVLVEPDPSLISREQRAYLSDFLVDVQQAVRHNHADLHYSDVLNVEPTIDHHIMRIFTLERDSFNLSTHLHKDRSGKLQYGPIWDFDRSMGMDVDDRAVDPSGFGNFGAHWFEYLFKDPDFNQAWVDRWQELRKSIFTDENFAEIIDGMAAEIAEAQVRNFSRWPEVAPNGGQFSTSGLVGWEGEISHLKGWLSRRLIWIDEQLRAPVALSSKTGVVEPGFEVMMSAPSGTIYYTLDGSDPRLPGGGVNPLASVYDGWPITINETTRIFARDFGPAESELGKWSGPTIEDFITVPRDVYVTEVNYHPHDAVTGRGELDRDHDDFEFIELTNFGTTPIQLGGMQFVDMKLESGWQGIEFTFAQQTLGPSERIVVVADREAFESRYGMDVRIAGGNDGQGGTDGEYGGDLADGGERVTLLDVLGTPIIQLPYGNSGAWPARPDGHGSSLQLVDHSVSLIQSDNWRSSIDYGGTPGAVETVPPTTVLINEVLTNSRPSQFDAIELINMTGESVDVGGWGLSNSADRLDKYVIPLGTIIPPDGYLVFDETDFNSSGVMEVDFELNASAANSVFLVELDDGGIPSLYMDHVELEAARVAESFGRWPNGSGDLFPMAFNTFGSTNSDPRVGPVVISEIMYHPEGANLLVPQLREYLELYNPSPWVVDLSNWTIDRIEYQFPQGATIDAGQTVVLVPFDPVTHSSAIDDFEKTYNVDISLHSSKFFGPYVGDLHDDSDVLTLRRVLDPFLDDPTIVPWVIEDLVSYSDQSPWPAMADGAGDSLHRVRVDQSGNVPSSWTSRIPSIARLEAKKTVRFTRPPEIVIGETGTVMNVTHEPLSVPLAHTYDNPVVIALPAFRNGIDPVVVRVNNVQSNQFDLLLAEPSNLDGLHEVGEPVGYVVLEAGSYWFPDGIHVEAATVATNATVSKNDMDVSWETVEFLSSFDATPVILSQLQAIDGDLYLSTRQQGTTMEDFQVAIEPEQLVSEQQAVETIGYLAIDEGIGNWNGMPFEAEFTEPYFTHSLRRRTLEQTFLTTPNVLASLASYNGVDNAHLRFTYLAADMIVAYVEEDTTYDTEIFHRALESISFLAIGGQSPLTSVATSIPNGMVKSFDLDINETGRVSDLDVTLQWVHARSEDLDVFLESPDGTLVELFTDVTADDFHINTTIFDDEALLPITTGMTSSAGRFRPEGLLSNFNGTEIAGTWTLHITDDEANNGRGALLDWSIDVYRLAEPIGNLNHDGGVDATDIDLVFANLSADEGLFDLDGDGEVDDHDVAHLVQNVMGKRFGDVDLDQDVDSDDVNTVLHNYDSRGQNDFQGWAEGNFDGDKDVDLSDFLRLAMNYAPLGYSPPSAATLPIVVVPVGWSTVGPLTTEIQRLAANRETVAGGSMSPTEFSAKRDSVPSDHQPYADDPLGGEQDWVDEYFRLARRHPARGLEGVSDLQTYSIRAVSQTSAFWSELELGAGD